MKIGIVGSSRAKHNNVIPTIMKIILTYPSDTEFVSGGAKGIDEAVEEACYILSRQITVFKPKEQSWTGGFKERNLKIAKYCDKVISIAMPYHGKICFHCNSKTHDKTGGCYTMKHAKEGELIILD